MNIPKVSIIIPVYNAEKYLQRCIKSLLSQTLTDFEAILINDGSKDNSGKICNEYAEKDKRFKTIHKKNGGVASARQCGLEHATGEYTIHVDPDDWIEKNMLEDMYNYAKANNADIVITDFITETIKGTKYNRQCPQSLAQKDVLKDLLMVRLHGSCWNKMLRSKIYKYHNIGFIHGINMCEDVLFWYQILQSQALTITYINKAWYHYDKTTNENSISNKINASTIRSLCAYINQIENLIIEPTVQKEKGYAILYTLFYLLKNGFYYDKSPFFFQKYQQSIEILPTSKIVKCFFYLSSKCRYILYMLYITFLAKNKLKVVIKRS